MKKSITSQKASSFDANVLFFAFVAILATLAIMVVKHATVINLI